MKNLVNRLKALQGGLKERLEVVPLLCPEKRRWKIREGSQKKEKTEGNHRASRKETHR